MPKVLYRIVRHDPATREDFLSHAALGRHPYNEDPKLLESWRKVSTFTTEVAARTKGRGKPWLGQGYVARLDVPDGSSITVGEPTGRFGHCDVEGTPDELLACVVSVVPL